MVGACILGVKDWALTQVNRGSPSSEAGVIRMPGWTTGLHIAAWLAKRTDLRVQGCFQCFIPFLRDC